MVPTNHVAYTAPVNPAGSSPTLTMSQIWPLLQRKIRAAQDFVASAILATDVISTSTTDTGLPVTVREIIFRGRRVRETCTEFYPMKVEFLQDSGSKVTNIVSEGPGGEEDLWMTYTFEWLHPECEGDEKRLAEKRVQERAMAKTTVESTITAMREIVRDGK